MDMTPKMVSKECLPPALFFLLISFLVYVPLSSIAPVGLVILLGLAGFMLTVIQCLQRLFLSELALEKQNLG
jgi:hypothetical protein